MRFQDLHMHTIYDDGADTPEKMVCAAISKGLSSVGISIHSPIENEVWCAKSDAVSDFVREVNQLKLKYESQISVYCGIEYDLFSDCDLSDFDYVIGSSHMMKVGSINLSIDNTIDELKQLINVCGSEENFILRYFEQVAKLSEIDEIDIIGHLDLPTKFNEKERIINTESKCYVTNLSEVVSLLCGAGKIIELNTGAMSRGYRTEPYPSIFALQEIRKHDGLVILSSDAHSAENIAFKFENTINILKYCGFERISVLDKTQFKYVSI